LPSPTGLKTLPSEAVPKDGLLLWLSAKHGVDDRVGAEDEFRWANQSDGPYEFVSENGSHPAVAGSPGKPGL